MLLDLTDDELALMVVTLSAAATSLTRVAAKCHRDPDFDPQFEPAEALREAAMIRVLCNRLTRHRLQCQTQQ